MSEQEINEICKSVCFGMAKEEICEVYDITADELSKIIADNGTRIEEIKAHYKEMEG